MVVDFNIENFLDCFFNILDSRVTKLFYFSRVCEDNMIVLAVKIRFFILRLIFTKLVFSYQPRFQKKFYSIVESSSTDPIVFIFHGDVQ